MKEPDQTPTLAERLRAEMAREICHYSEPGDANSCCPGPMGSKACQLKAAACWTVIAPEWGMLAIANQTPYIVPTGTSLDREG